MKIKKYLPWFYRIFLLLFWSGAAAFFLFKIGERRIVADFLRPFILFFLLAVATGLLFSAQGVFARVSGLFSALFSTLAGCCAALIFSFYKHQRRALTMDDLYAVLQSDTLEMYHYGLSNFLNHRSLFTVLGFLVLSALLFTSLALKGKAGKKNGAWKGVLAGISLVASVVIFTQILPVRMFSRAYVQYTSDLAELIRLSGEIDSEIPVEVTKTEQGELYIIVIGESEGRDFMQTYSGPYPNTPWQETIARDPAWIIFPNAYSNHTHTVAALSSALGEGRELTGRIFPKGLNILNVARKAGIKTHWLSNQAALGPWDNPIAALAHQADETVFTLPKSQSFNVQSLLPDDCLLPHLERTLEHLDFSQNNLIVVHLMGSHGPYEMRYPDGYPEPEILRTSLIGAVVDNPVLAARCKSYLATIRHTDQILKEIFTLVSRYEEHPTFMMYFSDHGEDIFSKSGGHDFSNFTWYMARIPMMVWLSDAYQARYKDVSVTLADNANRFFTNDLVYDLFLGLTNIAIPGTSRLYDISSPEYSLTLHNGVIAGQNMLRDDPVLIARQNIDALRGRVAMHRANTIFKVAQGKKLGLASLEVDVLFADRGKEGALIVGHDPKTSTDMTLEEYLGAFSDMPDFLWLDMKNLTTENAEQVLDMLERLDRTSGLKAIALFESSSPAHLELFSRAGWETSYYLPWESLLEQAQNPESDVFEKAAAAVRRHSITAVSYDLQADEVVRTRLAPLLPPGTALYAWNTRYNFSDPDLVEKLGNLGHLKRLLVTFTSPYTF